MKKRITLAIVLVIVAGCAGWMGYRMMLAPRPSQRSPRSEAAPVTVAVVAQKAMPLELRLFGTVEANYTVDVKSQITGILTNVAVLEGQDVQSGDLMFMIDARPWQVALKQEEANLMRARAQRDNAQKELSRQDELHKKGVASEDDYDKAKTDFTTLSATALAEEAALENARLQVAYCTIRAQVNGRIGELKIQEGNLVKANDIPLTTINQIKPIKVTFAAPQKEQPEIMRQMAKGPLEVRAYLPNSANNVETGRLVFVNNQIDTRTGTIQLKGYFDNARGQLWPGQFVDVVLRVSVLSNAVVVPSQAVVTGQNGAYLFAVKPDMTVELRAVTVIRTSGEETIVDQEVKPGEQVVTDGQLRLSTGSRITINNATHAAGTVNP